MAGAPQGCTARAPGSVGNVAVGFDVLGQAFDAVGDTVRACRRAAPGIEIRCSGPGSDTLPRDVAGNTAGRAAQAVLEKAGVRWGLSLALDKGIPPGSGLGGSGASAVAAAVAVNGLLEQPLGLESLLDCALEGEAVATGARVVDNVASSLLGGLVFAADGHPPLARRLPVPESLTCVVVLPELAINTGQSRTQLASMVSREVAVRQMANLAGVLAGCQQGDYSLLARFLRDVMIEPQRAAQVPGFYQVQEAAMGAGALGCSLSGSGPSLFSWCRSPQNAAIVAQAMGGVFASRGIGHRHWVGPVNSAGAAVVGVE